MQIRPVRNADGLVVQELLAELGYTLVLEAVERNLERYERDAASVVMLATENGKPIAMISGHIIPLIHQEGGLGRITSLVVGKSHRRRGVGTRLTKELELYFAANGCARIEVTSGERRADAHTFYADVGFRQSGVRLQKETTVLFGDDSEH